MHMDDTMASLVNLALRLNEDFRQFARIPINAKAIIRLADQVFEGEAKILSLKGAYVTVNHPIEMNSSVTVC